MTTDAILPAATRLGMVALNVSDLARSLAFYQESLGMQHLGEENGAHLLGAGEAPLLRLFHRPEALVPPPRSSGLYHFALLFPSRPALAAMLWRLAARNTEFQGFADHLVSEAIYLADPEGNGIELYRDRPREQWQYEGSTVQISTLPLDTDDLLAEATAPAAEMAPGTTVGHIHLQVGDLARAVHFYENIVGFEMVTRYGPSAAFLSAGGYHHHLGLNTWAGVNAPRPPSGSRGLRWFQVVVPGAEALSAVLSRIRNAGHSVDETDDGYVVTEPSGAHFHLTLEQD